MIRWVTAPTVGVFRKTDGSKQAKIRRESIKFCASVKEEKYYHTYWTQIYIKKNVITVSELVKSKKKRVQNSPASDSCGPCGRHGHWVDHPGGKLITRVTINTQLDATWRRRPAGSWRWRRPGRLTGSWQPAAACWTPWKCSLGSRSPEPGHLFSTRGRKHGVG